MCATQGVTYTKRDAQEAMLKLMQGNVVLVGHALHHDLHALQLDPTAVIDTALLCSYKCATFLNQGPDSVASEVVDTALLCSYKCATFLNQNHQSVASEVTNTCILQLLGAGMLCCLCC